MKELLQKSVVSALGSIGISAAAEQVIIEHPAELSHGDYATGAALAFAKQAGMAPKVFAKKLVSTMGTIAGIEKIETAGPGFINFTIDSKSLWKLLEAGRSKKDEWGGNDSLRGKKVMVEYTDPNPFKEFHIGHLMSNAVGESIARLAVFSGADVQRANYQGDVGPHVAKAIWGIKNLGLDAESAISLGKAYAAGSKVYEDDEAAKKEIDEINTKLYDHSDAEIDEVYTRGRTASLEHFETIYKILGTKFDHYFFESVSAPKGMEIVRAHTEVFEESDGAVVYKGEQDGLHTRVFITSRGLPTYEAKELGLTALKEEAWDFDTSITVTANEQSEYFKVVLAAMRKVLPDAAAKIVHVSHGMMRLATGKMSSRTGDVITGESLLADLIEAAKERAAESRADDKEQLAQDVAVAAIKYQILRQTAGKDIIFDKERALSLEGDSGPYLQYAYARTNAILKKADETSVVPLFDESLGASDLGRMVYRFHDVVAHAQEDREPHFVATYLTQVAAAFNSWYSQEQILDGTPASAHKVALVEMVGITLANGLWLLGIPAPEKM